jgi:hypothetical protein
MGDFSDAVRPVFFQTELEEFLYATQGGTLFVVSFRGRYYALTCKHVFGDFRHGNLFVVQERNAQKGSKPAPVKTVCFPSSPVDGAVDTDVGDICVIEFDDDVAPDFFKGCEYVIDETTIVTSQPGHHLQVAGVLKEKTIIDPPDISIGYCRLDFQDVGVTSDPFLRHAVAWFPSPAFSRVTGISGAPVFDLTANALCGMVIRGGMNGKRCEIRYVDILDIVRLLEGVNTRAENVHYIKHVPKRASG